jgi:hypothetical protein
MNKILIIGNKQHGKDTVAGILNKLYGLTFKSSSEAALDIFLFDILKQRHGYKTKAEALADKDAHRPEWFTEISNYNKKDKARLAKGILKSNDIYVGMRSNEECQECVRIGLLDLVIGVFDPRKPLEPSSSFDIDLWKQSDFVIPNAGTLAELEAKVEKLQWLFI